jgi:hypothetical protein
LVCVCVMAASCVVVVVCCIVVVVVVSCISCRVFFSRCFVLLCVADHQ